MPSNSIVLLLSGDGTDMLVVEVPLFFIVRPEKPTERR